MSLPEPDRHGFGTQGHGTIEKPRNIFYHQGIIRLTISGFGGAMAKKPQYTEKRRSSRVKVELPIQVAGTDSDGRGFIVQTQTLTLSRYGAKIRLDQGLVPEQEITLYCPAIRKESEARVVALFRSEKGAFSYGVEFLDQKADFWNVPFPPSPWEESQLA
jgi:PilZ domain-containing protein